MVDVEHIETHFLVICSRLTPHHLPETSQPGLHGKQFWQQSAILGALCLGDRSWSDEADVAAQDAEERGKLVKTVFAQHSTDASDARIVGQLVLFFESLEHLRILVEDLIGVNAHGSKLQVVTVLAISANIRAAVENGAAIVEFDQHTDDRRQ